MMDNQKMPGAYICCIHIHSLSFVPLYNAAHPNIHDNVGNLRLKNSARPQGRVWKPTLTTFTVRESQSDCFRKGLLGSVVPVSFLDGKENRGAIIENGEAKGTVNLCACSERPIDRVRAVTELALERIGNIDTPLIMMDLNNVSIQFNRWKRCLPRIQPYYAVKCNPDATLVAYLQSLGCDFDCATKAEMDLVVNQLSHRPDGVVFSNPCKLESHIRYAKSVGVKRTIIDNRDEILKIKANFPTAQVLIRLACSDEKARSPMSMKFGATRDQVKPLLELAAEVGLEVIGVHFHVGSGCSDPTSYRKALTDARRAFDIGREFGHDMYLVDLGGGYPGLNLEDGSCKTSNGVHFEEMALVINSMIDQLFPENDDDKYQIIAEPGRFFGQSAQAMVTKVMGKSVVGTDASEGSKLVRYYMTEGLYGTLSCIIFDQQDALKPFLLRPCPESTAAASVRGIMFGPTCDGFDKIGELKDFPELSVGDRLVYLEFGAYTSSSTTRFNGFDPATFFYYKSESN